MKSELLDRLEEVRPTRRGWRARCPAHPDKRPSLDLAEGTDGRLLVQCRAGCRTTDVLQALGAGWADLFRDPPRRRDPRRRGSLLDQARERVLAEARRQPWARSNVLTAYRAADLFRSASRVIVGARHIATELGPEDLKGWELLAAAAGLERVLLLEDGELVA